MCLRSDSWVYTVIRGFTYGSNRIRIRKTTVNNIKHASLHIRKIILFLNLKPQNLEEDLKKRKKEGRDGQTKGDLDGNKAGI